ncbi:UNVERIFIED_CONTAM: protein translation factor SUI1 [Sesamum latifolium]|uniref:Protein translation factor SUI1 n=1 Tax=Sesamum latifolium TaxID=2727402 RepID=A0AAW2TPQ2_9LAMI
MPRNSESACKTFASGISAEYGHVFSRENCPHPSGLFWAPRSWCNNNKRVRIRVCDKVPVQASLMVEIDLQIPSAFDPFAEAKDSGRPGAKEYVHIRIQQRNGKKSLTTVQGLRKEFSYEKILKDLKKEFCCNGTVVQDKELGKVIQLQGDQRKNVSQFLISAGIVKKDQIKIHGF